MLGMLAFFPRCSFELGILEVEIMLSRQEKYTSWGTPFSTTNAWLSESVPDLATWGTESVPGFSMADLMVDDQYVSSSMG